MRTCWALQHVCVLCLILQEPDILDCLMSDNMQPVCLTLPRVVHMRQLATCKQGGADRQLLFLALGGLGTFTILKGLRLVLLPFLHA